MKRRNKTKIDDILEIINSDDAFEILVILAKEDESIARRIGQIAKEYLSEVDTEDIACRVYSDLDSIPVEDVWDRSGSTRDEYVDPYELAWQMFEDALEPYLDEIRKYQDLSMDSEAANYCKGTLKAICRFETESVSEFKDWAGDAPSECLELIIKDYKNDCKNPKYLKDLDEFVEKIYARINKMGG